MSSDLLSRFARPGMAFLVGTVGPDGAPACCRLPAVTAAPDLSSVTIYVPVATGQQTIANIASTQRLAVVGAYPIDHVSIQIKGMSRRVRLARDDEATLVDDYVAAAAATLEVIGLPRWRVERFAHWPAFAIDVDVHAIFDQTPGPRAGSAIE
jgi:hypothetical protein